MINAFDANELANEVMHTRYDIDLDFINNKVRETAAKGNFSTVCRCPAGSYAWIQRQYENEGYYVRHCGGGILYIDWTL